MKNKLQSKSATFLKGKPHTVFPHILLVKQYLLLTKQQQVFAKKFVSKHYLSKKYGLKSIKNDGIKRFTLYGDNGKLSVHIKLPSFVSYHYRNNYHIANRVDKGRAEVWYGEHKYFSRKFLFCFNFITKNEFKKEFKKGNSITRDIINIQRNTSLQDLINEVRLGI